MSERIASSGKGKRFTSFVADIDLFALGNAPCREIICYTSGAINVQYAGSLTDGTSSAIHTVTPGTKLTIQGTKILASGTTVTDVVVHW